VLVVVETGSVVVDDVDGAGRSPDEWSGGESPEQAVAAATSATTRARSHTAGHG